MGSSNWMRCLLAPVAFDFAKMNKMLEKKFINIFPGKIQAKSWMKFKHLVEMFLLPIFFYRHEENFHKSTKHFIFSL